MLYLLSKLLLASLLFGHPAMYAPNNATMRSSASVEPYGGPRCAVDPSRPCGHPNNVRAPGGGGDQIGPIFNPDS